MTRNTNHKELNLSSTSSVNNFLSGDRKRILRFCLGSDSAKSGRQYRSRRMDKPELLFKLRSKSDTSLDKRGLTTNGTPLSLVLLLEAIIAFVEGLSYTHRNKESSSCSRHVEGVEMFETNMDEQNSDIMKTNEPHDFVEKKGGSSKKSTQLKNFKRTLRENKKGVTLEEAQNSTAKGTTSSFIPFESVRNQRKGFYDERQSLLQIQERQKNEIAELKEALKIALNEGKANIAGMYERIQIEKSQLQMELSAARADVNHNILLARKKEEDTTKVVEEAQRNLAELAKALEAMQSQLDSRTNELQMMAVTCESQAAEINELKAQNERLPLVPNTMFQSDMEELTNINVRWQEHDKKRVAQINKLKEKYEKEITELKAEIRGNPNQAVVFNEVQQERVDDYLQRLRRREDEIREQLEAAVMDAQRQAEVAKQQMEDASRKAKEQETRAEELNAKVTSLSQQGEELRTALIVATRWSNSQNAPDQQTTNNLQENIRQNERNYREMAENYQRALEENTTFLARLSHMTARWEENAILAEQARDRAILAEEEIRENEIQDQTIESLRTANHLLRQILSLSSPATP